MTAQEVLDECFIHGVDVYLRADGKPAVKGKPNAALLAALKMHRDEIIRLLGGDVDREWCQGCEMWIYEAEDTEAFCFTPACEFRLKCRQHDRM